MSVAPVIRAVTVDTSPEHAFTIFTERIADWWPLAIHTPSDALAADLAFVDGALVETSASGEASVWGTVTAWDPPRHLALTWAPGGGPVTAVAVDFEQSGDQTRVVLRHSGWEAYGDRAQAARNGYDGEHAWGWVLDLFSFASGSPAGAEPASYDTAALRAGYEAVALALQGGPFGEPDPDEWTARQVAGHVTTNAELMCQVVDDVRAGRTARLHGPDDHRPEAVDRFEGVEYDDAARALRLAGAEFVARCVALTADETAAKVSTYIEHHGNPVVDGEMTLADLLTAEVAYHLPAHVGQIEDLATPASGD